MSEECRIFRTWLIYLEARGRRAPGRLTCRRGRNGQLTVRVEVDDEVVRLVMVYAKAERKNVMPKEIKRRKA